MLLREFLQAKGYSADLCPDGDKGYKAFLKGRYDLCVLDVMMPRKDGFTLAQEIRNVSSETPIIFLTARNMKEDTAVQKWLMEHSWEYGFVLRYPNGKSELTGIIYEPWHYRYVGKEAAAEMRTLEVCLEEYLDLLHDGSGTSTNF